MEKAILIALVACFFMSCQDKSDDLGNIKLSKEKISGYVQKGPFINGTSIDLYALNENYSQTGNIYNTTIIDNKGTFEVKDVELESNYIEVVANGYYFNEVSGEKSSSQLTLYAMADVQDKTSINVNVLTHLEKDRVKFLLDEGIPFAKAKDSAQYELLLQFGFLNSNIGVSENLDISVNEEGNAILLAISILLQANRTVADFTELLANIATDIRVDGVINSDKNLSQIYNEAKTLDLVEIRQNIEDRYDELGVSSTIPDFETKINDFILFLTPFDTETIVTDISCNGLSDGEIFIEMNEGNEPYTYEWSNGETSNPITGLGLGTYSVTITDDNDYVMIKNNIQINQPEAIVLKITSFDITGTGLENGQLDLSVNGGIAPYKYNWSNGETSQDLIDLPMGEYKVTVTDDNLCEATDKDTIKEPITLSFDIVAVSTCHDSEEGSITMTVTGGMEPYDISWSNGSIDKDLELLAIGEYEVTVTDELKSTITEKVSIKGPNPLKVDAIIANPTPGNNDGSVDIIPSGGVGSYIILWNGENSQKDLSNIYSGVYNLAIEDEKSCRLDTNIKVHGLFTDSRDNIEYKTIKIGEQVWMAENLRATAYADGTELENGTSLGELGWEDPLKYYFSCAGDATYDDTLGLLYTFAAFMNDAKGNNDNPSNVQGICPDGFHIPSDNEFKELEIFMGINPDDLNTLGWHGSDQGTQLKLNGTSGFDGLMAGVRTFDGNYWSLHETSYFATTTPEGDYSYYYRSLNVNDPKIFRDFDNNINGGFSVRCIKDL